ncbi:phosphoheptose isomerase [Rhizobium sp. Root274]|uniref:D-sedoheptulose-7-phosphate isomerase n=1 Tax=unclassified Rhizobium TaxID=2613769 RepID=UPI000714DFD5|nr:MULTISPECIES: SIS domain-containing protein [unclassified Rhizobium]KQW31326.1 phosphoheptose isomerase [Rhizobium sp. Root1240]KRD32870.1 phosphoheptose isomerase [Rhizobium sp. Root274]
MTAITHDWLNDYFDEYKRLTFDQKHYGELIAFAELARTIKAQSRKMMFAGNGASAAIAAHGSVDFTKQGGVRAVNFNEADLITCFANDYGYDKWMAKSVEFYGDAGDAVVLISVSGTSPSVVEAAKYAKANGMTVVTFTGKQETNALKQLGDINFWVDSHAYNIVECIHMIWLTAAVDMVIGKAEYSVV